MVYQFLEKVYQMKLTKNCGRTGNATVSWQAPNAIYDDFYGVFESSCAVGVRDFTAHKVRHLQCLIGMQTFTLFSYPFFIISHAIQLLWL